MQKKRQLFLSLEETEFRKYLFSELNTNGFYIRVSIGAFQIDHEEIGMFVLLDPADHPSDGGAGVICGAPGFVDQLVIGVDFRRQHAFDEILGSPEKGQLVEIKLFDQSELLVGIDPDAANQDPAG